MVITAEMIKQLREETGAGMMECKKALVEAKGDKARALELVQKAGYQKADKSASRAATQGRIAVETNETGAVMVEVNCETDFVARDQEFIQFCGQVASVALKEATKTPEDLLAAPCSEGTVDTLRRQVVARIGENIQVRRMASMAVRPNQVLGSYVHQGRIGALVLLEGGQASLAKDIAMHVVSMRPLSLSKEGSEKDTCLLTQAFFKDPDRLVETVLEEQGAHVLEMIRLEVGEGLSVEKASFEEEVMRLRGNH